MRTVKRNPLLSGVCAILGGVFLWAGAASADVTSDRPAGILVLPKLVFDSDGRFSPNGKPTDTEIQITNVSTDPVRLQCYYVNANSHCSNSPLDVCFTTADCQQFGLGGLCFDGWVEVDFQFTLTPRQPLIWRLSDGLPNVATSDLPVGQARPNSGSIPGASEDPFFGELKCIEIDENGAPVDRNDLKGEATIIAADGAGLDARAYNAIGIQAVSGANDGDNHLILGGPDPEYNGCPSVLILDHFFDDGVDPIDGDYIKTHLTLVPCSQNFQFQTAALFSTTVQFLVFNEFEQRFSASTPLKCFHEYELCSLGSKWDRPIGNTDPTFNSCQRSIFSAFVSGTLSGQTRIRGVDAGAPDHGNGVLGVAEEFFRTDPSDLSTVRASDAFNLHQVGERPSPDVITIP
jgi:hypothetical protein